jgi:predicted nucleotidyltransferase
MATSTGFPLSDEEIAVFCRRHQIRKLSLFGSILTDRFNAESDIDVLVEFEPGATVGLIRRAAIQLELADMVGHRIDLRTPAELSRYFRQRILDNAEVRFVH